MTMQPDSLVPPSSDGTTLPERRRAFGLQLRQCREEQGLSVDALAQTTRISVAFIQALEAGDMDRLPGQVFVKGFVRNITKALGCPEEALLQAFEAIADQHKPTSVLKVEIKNQPVRQRSDRLARFLHNSQSLLRRGVLVQVALPVAIVLVAVYWLATSAVLHRVAGHFRDQAGFLAGAPVRSLQLKEVATEPANQAPLSQAAEATAAANNVPASPEVVMAPPTAEAVLAAAGPGADVHPVASPELGDDGGRRSPSSATGEAPVRAENSPLATKATAAVESDPADQQVLELVVSAAVKIRLDVDKGRSVVKELTPDAYRFTFNQKADVMIYDASAVKIAFNGKQLGPLGAKGRIRRLSFQAPAAAAKKL